MLQSFFHHLPFFIILIGVLVFVHEAGHFLFAKLFKVKVHVFSLGFGPKLVGFQKGETLYKISLLPIGGYVKMLGEDPAEERYEEDRGRAIEDKPRWQRFLIIFAGPAMNVLLAFVLYFSIGLSHSQVMPATIGQLSHGFPAAKAGFLPGDQIESIDGQEINSWDHLLYVVAPHPETEMRITVKRGNQRLERTIVTSRIESPIFGIPEVTEPRGVIGIRQDFKSTAIGVESESSLAYTAGLRTFDIVETVDGTPVNRMIDLEKMLLAKTGRAVSLGIRRLKPDAGKSPDKKAIFPSWKDCMEDQVRTVALTIPSTARTLSEFGIDTAEDFVAYVKPNTIAERIGLKRGDRLTAIDGKTFRNNGIFQKLDAGRKTFHQLTWQRNGQSMSGKYKYHFIPAGQAQDLGMKRDIYDPGFYGFSHKLGTFPDPVDNQNRFAEALRLGWGETLTGIKAVGIGFKLLFVGKISFQSMGGPLMIGQIAGKAAEQGIVVFLSILAFISLNLGLVNLLPISVLDGGQILFILVESITRRPLKPIIKEKLMLAGVVLILGLLVLVTRNDIMRFLLPDDPQELSDVESP